MSTQLITWIIFCLIDCNYICRYHVSCYTNLCLFVVWWLLLFCRNQLETRREVLTSCLSMVWSFANNIIYIFCCHLDKLVCHELQEPTHRTILLEPFLNPLFLETLLSRCLRLILIWEWTCGMHPLLVLKPQKCDTINLVLMEPVDMVNNGCNRYRSHNCFIGQSFPFLLVAWCFLC